MRYASFLCALALLARSSAEEPKLVVEPAAFKTLVNPNCSHCKDEAKRRKGDLKDDDRVLCWIRGKYDGGAIPHRFFLNPYRVISDTYGVFVYDADAGFARGFAPSLDFTFHGWRNGVMAMKHKDGSLYSCLSGIAFAGPKKGTKLQPVPTIPSDWGWWLKRYPDTVAYHMFAKYKAVALPAKESAGSLKSRGPVDKRSGANAVVLGVSAGKKACAFPLVRLTKGGKSTLVAGKVGATECVVLYHHPTRSAAAYEPRAISPKGKESRDLTLKVDAKNADAPFADKETGSRWDIAGRCVAGKLKGWTLTWLDGVMVKWFAWSAEYPGTTIHGK